MEWKKVLELDSVTIWLDYVFDNSENLPNSIIQIRQSRFKRFPDCK